MASAILSPVLFLALLPNGQNDYTIGTYMKTIKRKNKIIISKRDNKRSLIKVIY